MTGPVCLIVLGAQIQPDGQPSPTLKRRLICALGAAQLEPDAPLILCGGHTTHQDLSEARVMADHLITSGLAPQRLILEEMSQNTLENALYAKKILQARGLEEARLYVISDRYHLLRARMIFKAIGLIIHPLSAPHVNGLGRLALSYGREVLSLGKWAMIWAKGEHKKRMAEIL